MSYIRRRRQAFYYAWRGLTEAFRRESHMKIHGTAALLVLGAGLFFSISLLHWLAVAAAIIAVLCAEILNTVIEKICDLVQPHNDDRVRYIKDISAAFVLLVCLLAVITGVYVFGPFILSVLNRP